VTACNKMVTTGLSGQPLECDKAIDDLKI